VTPGLHDHKDLSLVYIGFAKEIEFRIAGHLSP
jgi:hypothetical protein